MDPHNLPIEPSDLPVEPPKSMLHGLRNFVAMIAQDLERGHVREAHLRAIDLWNDLSDGGPYDAAVAKPPPKPRKPRRSAPR